MIALVLKVRLADADKEVLLLSNERKNDMYERIAAMITIPTAYLARILCMQRIS